MASEARKTAGLMAAGNDMGVQPVSKPNPDPTVATNDAVERAMKSERDYVDGEIKVIMERLRGIDTATRLLSDTASKVPQDIEKEVNALRTLLGEQVANLDRVTDERFASVANQFKERDTRSEREARDNKLAVDAAFAAQEKQAVAQNESNTLAISKSERATSETIKTNQELSKSTTDALTKSLDELKLQVSRIESSKAGATESKQESRAAVSNSTVIIGAVIAVLVFALLFYAALRSSDTPPKATAAAIVNALTGG